MDFPLLAKVAEENADFTINDASGNALLDLAMKTGISVDESGFKDKKQVSREKAVELLAGLASR
jgi:hypothetical protein